MSRGLGLSVLLRMTVSRFSKKSLIAPPRPEMRPPGTPVDLVAIFYLLYLACLQRFTRGAADGECLFSGWITGFPLSVATTGFVPRGGVGTAYCGATQFW